MMYCTVERFPVSTSFFAILFDFLILSSPSHTYTHARTMHTAQVAFCDALKALLTGLLAYVQDHHKTGLQWNAKGGDCAAFSGGGAAPPAPPAGEKYAIT